jgi:hypothetical protein
MKQAAVALSRLGGDKKTLNCQWIALIIAAFIAEAIISPHQAASRRQYELYGRQANTIGRNQCSSHAKHI